jgi:protein SCO1/2
MKYALRFAFILLSINLFALTAPQDKKSVKAVDSDQPEIGVVEHLGDTLPDGIRVIGLDEDTVDLKSLITKPTILNLVYYRCPGICSPVMNSLSEVIEKMDLVPGKDYQVITVSFDSREWIDLAAKKRKTYFSRMQNPIDSMGWRFFVSDSISIEQLTKAVGFNFKKTGNDYLHPGMLIILSPESKITRYHMGTYFQTLEVKLSLIEAAKGKAMPTISRVLSFCYSYDPQGQRYVLDVTKISGTIILFIGLVIFLVLVFKSRKKKEPNKKEE